MKVRKVSYLVISDIHLGHRINTTLNIVTNLRSYIKDNHNLFKKMDIFFIAGDIFDRLLNTNSSDYKLATEWITEVILYCKHNNIKLRILEGTPSHDWKQANIISTIVDKLNLSVDYKYIDTLDIEYMDDYGINILYVPDEYKHDSKDTYRDVQKLLMSKNLQEVDIAIMHGQFNYQLPILLASSHNEEDYTSIVKYYISIGHIHIPSANGKILAQGSFDRLTHGEEGKKGGMFISIYNTGDKEFRHITNKSAMLFNTYHLEDLSVLEIRDKLTDILSKNKKLYNIRIIVSKQDNMRAIIKPIKEKFLGVNIKVEIKDNKELEEGDLIVKDNVVVSFKITPDNIEELLYAEINKHDLSKTEMNELNMELKDIL